MIGIAKTSSTVSSAGMFRGGSWPVQHLDTDSRLPCNACMLIICNRQHIHNSCPAQRCSTCSLVVSTHTKVALKMDTTWGARCTYCHAITNCIRQQCVCRRYWQHTFLARYHLQDTKHGAVCRSLACCAHVRQEQLPCLEHMEGKP